LPMSSFQSRRRSGNPTYLSAVIPTVDLASYITDRPNGTIRIDQGYEKDGAVLQREPIIETDIDSVDTYEGGGSQSIVLTGYSTASFAPKSVALTGSIYRSLIQGVLTYRIARPYIFLNPGDTVTIDNDEFIVSTMSYSISAQSQIVEISNG
jgi:hypothetical protein